MIRDVRTTLEAVAEPGRAQKMSAYMRHQFPFLGVPAPARRAATRDLIRWRGPEPDWPWILELWRQPEREFQYVAGDHLARARLTPADLPRLRGLITEKSWWDSVDIFPRPVGRIADADTMRAWARDGNLWVRRVAILHQLGRGEGTDEELLEEIIAANLDDAEFFITKAIGWALRDHARHNPAWVRACVDRHPGMAALARREALKHLR